MLISIVSSILAQVLDCYCCLPCLELVLAYDAPWVAGWESALGCHRLRKRMASWGRGIIANRLGPTGSPEETQFHGAHWDQRVAVDVSHFDLRDNH